MAFRSISEKYNQAFIKSLFQNPLEIKHLNQFCFTSGTDVNLLLPFKHVYFAEIFTTISLIKQKGPTFLKTFGGIIVLLKLGYLAE